VSPSWPGSGCTVTGTAGGGSNVTFVHLDTNLNWSEAQSYCRKHHTDLARVRNPAENRQASSVIPRENVWIGLFRDSWKWVEAKNFSFRFWNEGNNEPGNNGTEECAAAHFGRSGQWEAWSCDQHKAFVCYSGKQNFDL
uniref:C-type lectin domain-containing protein n=1 Tax=Poecilia mexicana TaxID=48701 RepID=A0A3B3WS70_9TELE